MALHADGGLWGSKPYAASGAYIDRMSECCAACVYDAQIKLGPEASPFNHLHKHFMIVNKARLKPNPPMGMPCATRARISQERKQMIIQRAQDFLA
jgi:deoxyribodipyrimidine photolyase-related protein